MTPGFVPGFLHLFDKKRLFYKRRIKPEVVLLALSDQRCVIVQGSNNCLDRSTDLTDRRKPAAAVDDAVSVRLG